MRVGKLNRFVWIVREKLLSDFEEADAMTETIWRGWVHMRPASGKEIEVANAMQSQVSHVVEMQFPFKEIKANTDMIKTQERYGSRQMRTLNITAVLNVDEADRELNLMCVENTNG